MIFKKIKAGALQLTMFIVIIIALLLAAFIILVHTHKTFKLKTNFVLETVKNSDKGISYILHNSTPLKDTVSINLQDEDYKSMHVQRAYWGIFERVISISKIKNNTFKKIALIGASQPEINRTALYLEEQNKPLVLVGNTKIEGLAYLPKRGVRTGNISGHSYYGNALIYGNTKTSHQLPKINAEVLSQIKNSLNSYKIFNQEQYINLNVTKTYNNSFYNPLKVIYSVDELILSDVSLIGHIVIQSEAKIIVEASSKLKDVILIAPKIEIKNNLTGTFQAFASKEITVGKSCQLNYPSTLILNEKNIVDTKNTNQNEDNTLIKINQGSEIKGIIAFLGEIKNFKPQVFIDENATVTGEIYCNKNLELLGKVNGSVFASNFIANQAGSSYQNHIYNGRININKLTEEYVGISFENSKKSVAKWLY